MKKKKISVVTNEPLLNQITVSFQHPKFLLLKRGFKLLRTKLLVGYCAVRVELHVVWKVLGHKNKTKQDTVESKPSKASGGEF